MIEATKPDMHALGRCDGWQPWLGPRVIREPCDEPNRMLVRTASNAYFPQTMSVISLPDRDEAVAKAVDQVWEHYLQYVEDLDDLAKERKRKPPVAAALEGFSDEDVFAEIQSRKQGRTPGLDKSVKQAEFETLVSAKEEIGSDKPDGDFFARYLPKKHWDQPWMAAVERVVLVHRLREVIAPSASPASSRRRRTSRASWRSASPGPRWRATSPGSRPSRTAARGSSSSSRARRSTPGWRSPR